jgi:hypothetical protein
MGDVVIKEPLAAAHAAVACDEWTNCGLNGYFGTTALAVTAGGYGSFCLAHRPMDVTAGTAEAPCGARKKIEHVITDTASVTP